MSSEFLSGDALGPNAENASRCFFAGRFKCRLLVMRVAPVERVGGAAEEEAVVRSNLSNFLLFAVLLSRL